MRVASQPLQAVGQGSPRTAGGTLRKVGMGERRLAGGGGRRQNYSNVTKNAVLPIEVAVPSVFILLLCLRR